MKSVIIIGERINPSGKPKLTAALKAGDYKYVIDEALAQIGAGAHMLDINCGMASIDEAAVLAEVVREVQSVLPTVPLVIDSADPSALERAAGVYKGKAIINSVTGAAQSMERVFPIAAKSTIGC